MSYKNYSDDFIKGTKTEQIFKKVAVKRNWKIKHSSNKDDRFNHFDFKIKKDNLVFKVEVKGLKRLKKSKGFQDKYQILEWMNVTGNKGWMFGSADLIAFKMFKQFVLIERLKLLDFVKKNNLTEFDISSFENIKTWVKENKKLLKQRKSLLTCIDTNKAYRRLNSYRKDLITTVKTKLIIPLAKEIWLV